MCDECEEIEPLTVAYFGKADRGGWRPPAAARTAPVNDDRSLDVRALDERVVSGRPYAIPASRFVCAPEGGGARAREVD
ncbi:MAG TPA: hypothetical protein VGH49_15930 [Xanthobacteraceae bacterium]|jgi:hypothetical protein